MFPIWKHGLEEAIFTIPYLENTGLAKCSCERQVFFKFRKYNGFATNDDGLSTTPEV